MKEDKKSAVEMPGLWKAWKTKKRFSTLPTSPLEILAKKRRDFHIPTAPTTRAVEKMENQKQVFHFPTATIPSCCRTKDKRALGCAQRPNSLHPTGARDQSRIEEKEISAAIKRERVSYDFRLTPHWNE